MGAPMKRLHIRISRFGLQLDKVVAIKPKSYWRTPRSNRTYTWLFRRFVNYLRVLRKARARGFMGRAIQFNVKGRVALRPVRVDGLIRLKMHFLPDIYVTLVML